MRLSILFLLLASTAYGQALSVTCTKATQGSTATCTGSGGTGPYTYSVSAGSGSIGSSSGTYTPPTTVTVKQKVGPCQLLPPDHIYNTRIDALPVHADSATIIARGSTDYSIQIQPSFGTNIMTNATGTFDAVFLYTSANNGAYQILSWPFLKRETGVFSGAFTNVDRHVLGVNRETCEFSDIYNNYSAGENVSCPLCTAQSGVKYFSDHVLPTTGATDAAGMAQQPVALRLDDIQSGEVKHALRFTLANTRIEQGVSTNFQWPATIGNSTPSSPAPSMKYGMYVRLKNSVDISSYSATAQIILLGLKRYGMILTDGGTNWGIQTNTDIFLDYNARKAVREIFYSALRNDDFEVVDTSSMDISAANAAVNLGNGYVTPTQYAEVTVTDAAMATATTRVNLEGITVGTPESTMTIMAGHTVTPTWWVTGTATQTVTWTMDPDVGTLNSSTGQFTPDAGVTTPTRTRLTATSTVEATAAAVIDVVVWPDNASGNIYQDWGIGDTTTYTYDGKDFLSDDFVQYEGWNSSVDGNQAGDIYANQRIFNLTDLYSAKYYLPNGNYKVRIYLKVPGTGTIASNDYVAHYEAQGQLVYRLFSACRAAGTSCTKGVAGYVDIPMDVTDGSGYFALRRLTDASVINSWGIVAAVAIESDATTPYLAIDHMGVTGSIYAGQTRQFYAVGWYMSNSVTWSVQSGPGSIDSNGLFTAAAGAAQSVTVRATSTVDGAVYAETSFDLVSAGSRSSGGVVTTGGVVFK